MGKHGRILLVLGALGSLALVGAAVQGYGVHGAATDRGPLQTHLIYSLGATLAVFFSHTWVIVYLLSLRRELRRWRQSRQEPTEVQNSAGGALHSMGGSGEAVRAGAAIGWAVAASVLVLASFLLGPATLLLIVPPWVHGGAFYLAVVVQLGALVVESRALGRSDRALEACRRQDAAPAHA